MNTIDVAKAWKNKEYRESLSREELDSIPMNPVGEALTDLEASNIFAGVETGESGTGWFTTVSGECDMGRCCNPFGSYIHIPVFIIDLPL